MLWNVLLQHIVSYIGYMYWYRWLLDAHWHRTFTCNNDDLSPIRTYDTHLVRSLQKDTRQISGESQVKSYMYELEFPEITEL